VCVVLLSAKDKVLAVANASDQQGGRRGLL
jgi:hypothetical protein